MDGRERWEIAELAAEVVRGKARLGELRKRLEELGVSKESWEDLVDHLARYVEEYEAGNGLAPVLGAAVTLGLVDELLGRPWPGAYEIGEEEMDELDEIVERLLRLADD